MRMREDVEARDDGLALGGRHVAGDDAHRAGLARAVRTEEPENLAFLDAETDVVDRGDAAVAFREVLDLDHWNSVTFFRIVSRTGIVVSAAKRVNPRNDPDRSFWPENDCQRRP